jgi:hypothetical protein
MVPNLPRIHSRNGLNSARLVRLLADMGEKAEISQMAKMAGGDRSGAVASKQSFAEQLGLWLDWPDAIALAAALGRDVSAGTVNRRPAGPPAATAVFEDVARVRAELANAMASDALFNPGRPPMKRPPAALGAVRRRGYEPAHGPSPEAAPEAAPEPATGPAAGAAADADFSHYRRAYVSHQRAMAAAIGPLRARVRARLSSLSPALAQLAALDAVFDDALAARERHLLGKVPGLLEQHFAGWATAQRAAAPLAQGGGVPRTQALPADGLATVCRRLQGVLLAELDIRLQPIDGLLEAIGNEFTGQS